MHRTLVTTMKKDMAILTSSPETNAQQPWRHRPYRSFPALSDTASSTRTRTTGTTKCKSRAPPLSTFTCTPATSVVGWSGGSRLTSCGWPTTVCCSPISPSNRRRCIRASWDGIAYAPTPSGTNGPRRRWPTCLACQAPTTRGRFHCRRFRWRGHARTRGHLAWAHGQVLPGLLRVAARGDLREGRLAKHTESVRISPSDTAVFAV